MAVAYVAAGDPITATQLNALTAELDAIMGILYANKTPLIYEAYAFDFGRVVAFGNSANWKIIPLIPTLSGLSEYDHSTFTTAAAALTVASYDNTLKLANVSLDDPWPLDGSLEAHTKVNSGTTYWFNQIKSGPQQGYRERYVKLEVLDVLLEGMTGDLTWDAAWDKYHFIRFHNLDPVVRTVTMPGSVDIDLDPFGIQAVRRAYPKQNSYSTTYRYLWAAQSGDLLFLDGFPWNNVGAIKAFHDTLAYISDGVDPGTGSSFTQLFYKASDTWDGSSLLPQSISGTTELYKYYYHLGRIVSWTSASGTPVPSDFTPTWAQLSTGINGIKLNTSPFRIEANTGATTPVDACGIGASVLPVWPTTLPHSLSFVDASIACLGVNAETVTLSATYWDGSAFVDVETDYTNTELSSFANSAGPTDTLNTHATLTSASANEQLSTPTVSWTSDGWRMVGHGTQTIPFTAAVVPMDATMGYCDVTETGFVQHFGADVFNRGTDTGSQVYQTASRQHGRRLSPYVGFTDISDNVYYEGHPDLSGTYGLADGVDFTEQRVAPSASAYYRDEVITNPADTLIARVHPLTDSVDEIAANASDASWYSSNRTRLLAGQTEVTDRQKLVRYPILGRHYNAIAQFLNSVMAIKPLTLDSVLYYGKGLSGLADGTWSRAAYPDDFYCAVLATGSRAAGLGLTITGSGSDSHLTLATAAAWADSLGLRFFVRRMSGLRVISGSTALRTRSLTAPYRNHISGAVWLSRCVKDNSTISPPVYLAPPASGASPEEIVDVEHAQADGPTPPTGWQLDGNDALMTIPRPGLNYELDPLVDTPGNSVILVYPAADADVAVWDIASIDNTLSTSTTVSGWYGLSPAPDSRTPYELKLINRFFIIRTP